MDKTLIVLIVTFGLAFVMFAALAAGLTTSLRSAVVTLKGNALRTIGVLIANFVVVPVLTGLTLWAFGFTAQATMRSRCCPWSPGRRSSPCSPSWAAAMRPTRPPCRSSCCW
jgi:hypothetical protein